MIRQDKRQKKHNDKGFMKQITYIMTHLNLLGKMTLGVIVVSLISGIVLAIVFSRDVMTASMQTDETLLTVVEENLRRTGVLALT